MIIIYDFDGTLTPYSLPQYAILKQCGYTDEKIMKRVGKEMLKGVIGFYEAYYKCYRDILRENRMIMSKSNICLGAKETKLNNGVEEYLKKFQSSKTGVKHYIVTSGIKDYVDETAIGPYIDGSYGVSFKQKEGIFQDIDVLVTGKKKVNMIQKIQSENRGTKEVIYFGDGLTDEYAFKYVHSIGGKNIFVASNQRSYVSYQKMNINGMINQCFRADFRENSQISQYIQRQMEVCKEVR